MRPWEQSDISPTIAHTGVIIEHDGDRFGVIITGMGTGNAEATADAVLGVTSGGCRWRLTPGGKADAILVIGLGGGLTEGLPVHRLVAYRECLSATPNTVATVSEVVAEGKIFRVHGAALRRWIAKRREELGGPKGQLFRETLPLIEPCRGSLA
jgi:hypothetical protein